MYKTLRRLLFLFPPEGVHYFSMNVFRLLCAVEPIRMLIASTFTPRLNGQNWELMGLKFRNPVGLGAGFDKNAKYLRILEALGFGFVEIGTVTPLAQSGNDRPRLFRLPEDEALINRMGFNNEGVKAAAERLKLWREKEASRETSSKGRMIIGGNIGKNKQTANEDAWRDYETCFKELHPYVDYFVVNVSSPNTPGLRELQEKESLRKILLHLMMINNGKARSKPIFLKIAPDLTKEQIDDVIDLALEIKLDGLVASNTTVSRENLKSSPELIAQIGAGGLSGKVLENRSTEIVRYIHQRTDQVPVIASGGVFTDVDATAKFKAGAALVQVWTGFIYVGPSIVKKICKSL